MRRRSRYFSIPLLLSLAMLAKVHGQEAQPSPRLVICGGGKMPPVIFERFRELAGDRPILVVIPTASQRDVDVKATQDLWKSRGFPSVRVLHTGDRKIASSSDFASPLKTATAVWFGGGSQQRIADAYLGTAVEGELMGLVRRGGVIGGTSAGAAIQSRVMIAGGDRVPQMSTGFDLLTGAIIDQHFLKRNRIPRLVDATRTHPNLIGIGIDESTALIMADGQAKVVGASYVIRIESADGKIRVDAFGDGDTVAMRTRATQHEHGDGCDFGNPKR